MRYARLTDLVRLALMLQGRADGLSLDDIAGAFEVSRRTAERMRDAFPQVEEIAEPGGRKRWRLPPAVAGRLADPALRHRGAASGPELARASGDPATGTALDLLSDRLRARLAAPVRARLEPDIAAFLEADGVALRPGPRERIAPEVLAALRQAILAGVWIRADHRARATGRLSRNIRLGPLAMLLGEGRQYLVAWGARQKDVRLFALAGFEHIVLTDTPFPRPEGFDLSAYLARSFGIWQEEVHDIEWRYRVALHLRSRPRSAAVPLPPHSGHDRRARRQPDRPLPRRRPARDVLAPVPLGGSGGGGGAGDAAAGLCRGGRGGARFKLNRLFR